MSRNRTRKVASQQEIERALQSFHQANPTGPKLTMTVAQLAAALQVPKKTLYEWIQRGRFEETYRKHGKRIYFLPEKALDRFYNGPEWR